MEYLLKNKSSAIPCLIESDPDSSRYMVRNADTSGKGFNSKEEMVDWIRQNWDPEEFEDPESFKQALQDLNAE
ncbi:hypothetical protein GKZ89_01535 [Bacillus mangrovi]|uniref:Uncharacterized protein n=1 Tax=Metabacillus mangrovi TaxID=1491830 RepID=A0A7X2S1X4_9BACI|nr:hypothetical protein [Metabacillus mangrovi]MTH52070.1 hypothetical protein [Metabacillus mangrovi]